MSTAGIIGGVLVVVGGVYIIHKTGILQKIGQKLETVGESMKNSFMEGYQEAAKASAS